MEKFENNLPGFPSYLEEYTALIRLDFKLIDVSVIYLSSINEEI